MGLILKGRAVVPGSAQGPAVVSRKPISFWGGVSPSTGEIIDRRHDRAGVNIRAKVFVFPAGKGSSTGSAVLMEGIRNGTAPCAIITMKVDPILALGAIVSEQLYQKTLPVVVLGPEDFDQIQEGDQLSVFPDGTVTVEHTGQETQTKP